MITHHPAKDLLNVKADFVLASLQKIPTDPSREDSRVVIWFGKPIPCGQVFDHQSTVLEDSSNGEGKGINRRPFIGVILS